jgi:hypothetical protein
MDGIHVHNQRKEGYQLRATDKRSKAIESYEVGGNIEGIHSCVVVTVTGPREDR